MENIDKFWLNFINSKSILTSQITEEENDKSSKNKIDVKKAKQLKSFHNAPQHLKHNAFILSGYRGVLSTKLCWQSIFWWTNETINIWSHLFGIILLGTLTLHYYVSVNIYLTLFDKIILAGTIWSFLNCLLFSAIYHTFNCRSADDCEKFLCFDLFGIAQSLFAIYASGIYYAFACNTFWLIFYLTTVSVIFVIVMILQIPALNFNTNVKLLTFVSWAGYGALPTLHWTIYYGGLSNPIVAILLPKVLYMYLLSGIGFFFYYTKVPERFLPGRFDFMGHSHQWWHLFVVAAFWYWIYTGACYAEYRMNHTCPPMMEMSAF